MLHSAHKLRIYYFEKWRMKEQDIWCRKTTATQSKINYPERKNDLILPFLTFIRFIVASKERKLENNRGSSRKKTRIPSDFQQRNIARFGFYPLLLFDENYLLLHNALASGDALNPLSLHSFIKRSGLIKTKTTNLCLSFADSFLSRIKFEETRETLETVYNLRSKRLTRLGFVDLEISIISLRWINRVGDIWYRGWNEDSCNSLSQEWR